MHGVYKVYEVLRGLPLRYLGIVTSVANLHAQCALLVQNIWMYRLYNCRLSVDEHLVHKYVFISHEAAKHTTTTGNNNKSPTAKK